LALFTKTIKKVSTFFTDIEKAAVEADSPHEQKKVKKKVTLPPTEPNSEPKIVNYSDDWEPYGQSLADDLEEAGNEAMSEIRAKQRELLNSLDLSK
jgi:N-acetyltransferase 10